MTTRPLNPAGIVDLGVPNYVHGLETTQARRWVHLSGQVGLGSDGSLGAGFTAQCGQAFINIQILLADALMNLDDVVMLRIYLVDRDDLAEFRRVRGEFFGDRSIASTLIFVSGLVGPDWLVELEVVAARAD